MQAVALSHLIFLKFLTYFCRCKIAKQLVVDPFLQKELEKYKTADDFYIVSFSLMSLFVVDKLHENVPWGKGGRFLLAIIG